MKFLKICYVVVELRNVYKEFSCWFIMNGKRLLVIGLLGLFMISMFAGVVSADSGGGSADQVFTNVWDALKTMSFIESDSQTAGIVSKLLLMVLVVLLVYSVSDSFAPLAGGEKSKLRWGVAGIVGVLSFIFVSVENIQAILGTYEALGITMTTVIPFAILIYFAFKMAEGHPKFSNIIMTPIFVLFGVYLLFRWIYLPQSTPLKWIYLLTLGLIVLWLIFGKPIQKAFAKAKKEEERGKLEGVLDRAADVDIAKVKQRSKILDETGKPFE